MIMAEALFLPRQGNDQKDDWSSAGNFYFY